MKEYLIDSILKNSLSTDITLFMINFALIANLIIYFRESLKAEIAIFLEQLFLKILESKNSDFAHRKLTLRVI